MSIEIVPLAGGRIGAKTPYNEEFVEKCRQLGGRWDKDNKIWSFPKSKEKDVLFAWNQVQGGGSPVEQGKSSGGGGAMVPHQSVEIARREPTTNVTQIADVIREIEETGNAIVLTPSSAISHVPEDHAMVVRQLRFDPGRDFYRTTSGHALHKGALEKVAAAAGVNWVVDRCGRVDDRTIINYWEFQAVGEYRDPQTGTIRRKKAVASMDLRDGAATCEEIIERHRSKIGSRNDYKTQEDADKKARSEILQLRRFGAERADTRAHLRVIRSVTDVRNNYTDRECAMTFVLVSMVYQPQDEEIRRLHRMQSAMASQNLYGQGAGALGNSGIVDLGRPAQPQAGVLESSTFGDGEKGESPRAPVEELVPAPWEGEYPSAEEFKSLSMTDKVRAASSIVEESAFDYKGTMDKAGLEPVPIAELEEAWLDRLYKAALELLPSDDQWEVIDDDDIPF